MHLIGQKIFTILRMLIFPATEICCRAMLPMIIYLGTSSSTICQVWALDEAFECLWYDIVDLLLYVAYLSSCFGNSKMVTECELKPISMNFGSSKRKKGGFMCGSHGAGLDWPEEIFRQFSNNILLIFAAIKIWAELCCQSTMEHLSWLSAKFQAWKRHLRRLLSTKLL